MTDTPHASTLMKRKKPLWLRMLLSCGILLFLLIVAAPYAVQSPPVRDWLVNRIAERENVHARVADTSFGWFSPLELRGVTIESPYGEPLLDVARIRSDRPWWQLALADQRLGTFTIEEPNVTLTASPSGWNFQGIGPKAKDGAAQEGATSAGQPKRMPELTADVHGAAITLRRAGVAEPLMDVDHVNVVAHIKYADGARWLTVEPFRPLDRKRLTPSMCDNGLQLVAPVLANSAWTEGEVSLAIDEFRVPLDRRRNLTDASPPAAEEPTARASGHLELHAVETGLKNPLLQRIAGQVATIFGADMPTRVRVVDDSAVRFELRDRRVYHEGLAFGLPEVSPSLIIRTSGTVGLDKSLDLRVDVPVLVDLAFSGPIAQRFSGKTIQLAVTGTLDDPKISMPPEKSALKQFADLVRPESGVEGTTAENVASLARDLLPAAQNVVEGLSDTLARMRERRAERRAGRNPTSASEAAVNTPRAPEYEDAPGAAAGDALPPSPPADAGPREEPTDGAGADQSSDARPATRSGPLRRFLDRRRNRDG